MPFAVQGLIGTLAGPVGPGHVLREPLPRPRRGGRTARGLGLRARGDGGGHRRRFARPRRRRARRCTWTRPVERVLTEDGRASGLVLADGDEVSARAVVSGADPAHHGGAGRRGAAGGLEAGRARGEGDAPARRPARLHRLAGRGALAGDDRHRLLARRPPAGRGRRPGRAPGRRAVDRGRVPDLGGSHAGPRGPPRALDVLPVLPAGRGRRGRRRRGHRPLRAACAHSSRTGSWTALPSGRGSSRPASASAAGTSSTARCCPGSCFERRPDRRAFGGVEGLYLGGSGAHPGGAVTGAPGYLAAQAVIEDLDRG